MITAIVPSNSAQYTAKLRSLLAPHTSLLELTAETIESGLLSNINPDMAFIEVEHLTEQVVGVLAQVQEACPDCTTVCLATEEVAERARAENTLAPHFWIIVPASDLQLRTQLQAITALVTARSREHTGLARLNGSLARPSLARPPEPVPVTSHPDSALYRMMGRMTASLNTDELLAAYCDAVHERTHCVSYCLLWQDPDARQYRIFRAEGLPPMLEDACRLSRHFPLPAYLTRHRGIVTRDALAHAPELAPVLRELELFGGVLAIPLFSEAVLRGIMVLGPKAVGEPYLPAEAEALFVLSANAAAGVRQAELHHELEARNTYIDQILSTMESGIVTIGLNGTIRVCNPYAAQVLRLDREAVIGQDLRVLPSPLGDYLYACLTYGEERSREELTVLGGTLVVRVSTRRLLSPYGGLMGSMLIVEDMTYERALAQNRRQAERLEVINQVVARFAHELKNPLATIHTFAELVPTRLDDPEFQEFWAEHVKRDVRRLDDLVAKLVSLAEQPESSRELANVDTLLHLAAEHVEMLDGAAQGHVVAKLHSDLPPVRVDTNVMVRALAHLLRYALGPNYNTVTVEAGLQEGPEGESPLAVVIRAPMPTKLEGSPQQLLDPSYVMDHPDIDLGPSASQRLIESQGGALEAYLEGDSIVFRVTLIPAAEHEAGLDEWERKRLKSLGRRA